MRKISFLLLLALPSTAAIGQSTVHHQAAYWLRYQNQFIISPKVFLINEVDNRRFFNPDVENQFIIHTRAYYRHGPWDFGAGLTLSWIFTQVPETVNTFSVFELRPIAEAAHEFPVRKIFIQNRLRVDNRFFEEDQEKTIWDESIYVMRLRYRLQVRIPLKTNTDNIPTISVRTADEIMVNTSKNTFDQNRIYVTFDFFVNRNISLEAGYLYAYQQRLGQDEFYSRNIVRLSFLHRVYWKSTRP